MITFSLGNLTALKRLDLFGFLQRSPQPAENF